MLRILILAGMAVGLGVASEAGAEEARKRLGAPAQAFAISDAAQKIFPEMPALKLVPDVYAHCGAAAGVNPQMAYCTSDNTIYYRVDTDHAAHEAYALAHLYGHAVQVRHGVADVALRQITRRRDEEGQLRAWVEQQVDCIAGVLFRIARLPRTDLRALYAEEPMTDRHWGRNPLSQGPVASAGFAARAAWFDVGQRGNLSACAVGEFGSDLLLRAMR